ncbi:MAG TPA: Rap1a/Tai family immunity protein [Thermoanaerobaculia bacterium]|nr:Rap1a/Tai family immunity protein [Thermoanaerobaculia bacterium]
MKRPAARSARFGLPLAALVLAAAGCASGGPPKAGLLAQVGSVRTVLGNCLGDDPSYCHGFVTAAFDFLYQGKAICPPPLQTDDLERIVVNALRRADPDAPAITAATGALSRAFPCHDTPTLDTTSLEPGTLTPSSIGVHAVSAPPL